MEEEATGLAQYVRRAIERGEVTAGGVLVLAPRRQFGYAIRDALRTEAITAQSFFGEEALDNAAAQEAFTLLTLLARPDDAVALRCWCGFGSDSLRKGAWARIRQHCHDNDRTLLETLDALADDEAHIPYSAGIPARISLLRARLAELQGLAGQDRVDSLFPPAVGWSEPLRSAVEELGNVAIDAARLLEHLQSAIAQPELPADTDYVRVMSLHKSKGLTANLVIVAGLIEGLVPFTPEDLGGAAHAAALREQRRLFYVAVTRPKRELVLSSVTRLPRDLAYRMRARIGRGAGRAHVQTLTSRFVHELGPECPAVIRGDDLP
jgi:superfamily I DNA/RNA helicase